MSPVRPELPFKVNGRGYVADLDRVLWRPLNRYASAQDQGNEAGEQSLGREGAWKRTGADFVLGAGQTYFDLIEESTRRGFRRSRSLDCWTRRKLKLAPDVDAITMPAITPLQVVAGTSRMWLISATDSYATTNPQAGPPTWTQYTGLAGSTSGIHHIAMDPNSGTLFAARSGNLYSAGAGGSNWTVYSAGATSSVWVANGWLIVDQAGQLKTVDSGGVRTAIGADLGYASWSALVGGARGIYAASSPIILTGGNQRATIYRFGIDETDGSLNEPVVALELPSGEYVIDMHLQGDLLLIGVYNAAMAGYRLCRILDDGSLAMGPLVRFESPGYQASPLYINAPAFTSFAESVFCAHTDNWNDDTIDGSIVQIRLDRLVADLAPAHAHYLENRGSGKTVSSLTMFNNYLYFLADDVLYGQSDNVAPSGELWTGKVTFGVYEPKTLLSVDVVTDEVPAGATITVTLWDDVGDDHTLGTITATDPKVNTFTVPSTVPVCEWCELQLTLNRGTSTTAEVSIERWTMRALVLPGTGTGDAAVGTEDEIYVPVVLARKVRDVNRGTNHAMDPYEEWKFLEGIKRSGTTATIEFGTHSEQARLVDVMLEEGQRNKLDRWVHGAGDTFVEGVWLTRWLRVPTPLA